MSASDATEGESLPGTPIAEPGRRTRVLVVRPDRIGDVILSTPVLEALKRGNPQAEVHLLVRDVVVPVVENNPYKDKLLVYRPGSAHQGIRGFFRLLREIRSERYDMAITLQVRFRISFALYLAGIRYRVGPYSKWYSFLFFNRGRRQKRSAVEMHETDYNLMLLRRLGIRAPARQFEPKVVASPEALARMKRYLKELGVLEGTRFVVVHPGMGGSALNWPEGYYVDLIQRIAGRGVPVVVSGSVAEKSLVQRVVAAARAQDVAPIYEFLGASSHAGLHDLIGLLSLAEVVVAPSTGPLHVAVALGRKTVSFYPPIRVQSALRWGPYASAEHEQRHVVLVPDALCGRDFSCAGKKCHFYFCMERLGVEEAFQSVLTHLEAAK